MMLAACAASPLHADAPTFGDGVGLNVKFSQGQSMSQLPDLAELGVRWVRDGVDWPTLEPAPGKYLEAFPNAFTRRLDYYKANNIGVDFLLAYSNRKAYPNTADNPHHEYDAEAYGRYAAAVARLLKASGVRFVLEVWNEPHNSLQKPFGGQWQGHLPSAWVDQYVKMVEEAVKDVKAVDPGIVVLDQDDMWICHYWFLEKGLPPALDGISYHPYQGSPERTAVDANTDWCKPYQVVDADGSTVSAVRRLREQGKLKLGHTPQMWATEAGYETGGKSANGPLSEETIAAYVPRTFIVAAAAGVDATMWFSSYDGPDGPMGLTDNKGRHRKQYYAFRTMTQQLGASTLVRQVAGADDRVGGLQAWLFHGPDGYRLVAWNVDGTAPAALRNAGDAPLTAVDAMGQPLSLPAAVDGARRLSVGVAPIYLAGVAADVAIAPVPKPVTVVRLDDLTEGETDWTAGDATIQVIKDDPAPGATSLKYTADFTKGWHWNALTKSMADLDVAEVTAIRFKMKTDAATAMDVLLVDGSGQSHIIHRVPIAPDGQWHEVVFDPRKFSGTEHWGGANDGKWHGPPTSFVILLSTPVGGKVSVWLTDMRADAEPATVAQPAAFKADFEGSDQLPAGWTAIGDARIDAQDGYQGGRSLLLTLPTNATTGAPVTATGPTFAVKPGQWRLSAVAKSDLTSPDDSFSGVVTVQLLDGGGKPAQSLDLVNLYGRHDWQPVTQTIEVPPGVSAARFVVRLNKPSGRFWVDDLSAAYLAPAAHKDRRVARLLFGTSALGNLWRPGEPRSVEVRVESTKPLLEAQRAVTVDVRDYWGAPQMPPVTVTVDRQGRAEDRYLYVGHLDLSAAPLAEGRYYELHGAVPRPNDEPFENQSSFAILPEAATRQYKPEDIPFTARDWDDRLTEYLQLADRLGIRVAGLWSGWSAKPPYNPDAPGWDVVTKLGMGWVSGAPSSSIEGGKSDFNEAALRGGVAPFIAKLGRTRPLYFSLGNEPSGSGEQVARNVAAYKIVYEEIKRVDPSIFVIGTSIGPNEEYFKAGMGKYCDAYDFHTYAGVDDIRNAFASYRELMKKYDCVKPIWSTEMGMNSQGVARDVVASLMIKKFAIFFAEGGANCSWFDFLYPDGNGTNGASAGAAHDVFDSRFNRYCPKLTAISEYDIVNAIATKKFVAEKEYLNGVSAFLFRDRDGHALQILWRDQGRLDIALPLPGVQAVQAVLLDGTHRALNANGRGLTTSVGPEPLLLLYDGGAASLPDGLGTPAAIVTAPPALRGATSTVNVTANSAVAADVKLLAPPGWTVKALPAAIGGAETTVPFDVTAPEAGTAREAAYIVTLGAAGELYARAPVLGQLSVQVRPTPAMIGKAAGIRLTVTNNGPRAQAVKWSAAVDLEQALSKGQFGAPSPSSATFAKASSGTITVAGTSFVDLDLPLAGIDPLRIYHVQATVTDAAGHDYVAARLVGGFAGAVRAKTAPKLDGVLDEPEWAAAPVQLLNTADQIHGIDPQMEKWTSPQDVSARLRFLWDEKYLYVGVEETEAVGSAKLQADDALWAGNGLQFLVDAVRERASKPGYYDFSLGVGLNGPAAWMHSSADPGVPTGRAREILVSAKRKDAASGDITYEVAIPWTTLAPFKPAVGADLGLSMAINTDHGKGRHGFMTWFGDVQDKSLDTVGDVILGE
jgi:hypothetical protein